jgi:L,D-peptidoglycan transpeptidase YkuD (ErfK/YbiS/YcfS/YnhG family)
VGHRRFFESSETVSDAWKRSPQDMLPRREMLGIGAKRGNVHRPFSASSMGSQGGVGAVGRAGMSAHRNQRAEYTGGAAATMSLRPGAYENASMNATRAQQQRVRPQSAYASSAGSGSQRRRQQQQYMVQEEEAWRSERRGSAGRNSFRGGGGSVAGSSSTGEMF